MESLWHKHILKIFTPSKRFLLIIYYGLTSCRRRACAAHSCGGRAISLLMYRRETACAEAQPQTSAGTQVGTSWRWRWRRRWLPRSKGHEAPSNLHSSALGHKTGVLRASSVEKALVRRCHLQQPASRLHLHNHFFGDLGDYSLLLEQLRGLDHRR